MKNIQGKFKDYTGEKYGRLTFVSLDRIHMTKSGAKKPYWLLKCDCGGERIGNAADVVRGHAQSCGCLHKEATSKARRIHGEADTPLYFVWENMKKRCLKPNSDRYKNYGARGITIHPDWLDYSSFSKWAHSNGYAQGLTIERLDVNGNYEPLNCTWIEKSEQSKNKTNNKWVVIEGEKYSPLDLEEKYEIPVKTIYARIARGDKGESVIRPLGKRQFKKR